MMCYTSLGFIPLMLSLYCIASYIPPIPVKCNNFTATHSLLQFSLAHTLTVIQRYPSNDCHSELAEESYAKKRFLTTFGMTTRCCVNCNHPLYIFRYSYALTETTLHLQDVLLCLIQLFNNILQLKSIYRHILYRTIFIHVFYELI